VVDGSATRAGLKKKKIVLAKFKNFITDEIFEFSLCLTKALCYYRCTNAFQRIFSHKAYSKVDLGRVKISDAIFSGQSYY